MVGTFHIVLKQEEGFDVHDTREFDLALDSKFAIGRASKNQAKGYLLPAKHNVFIDSPVVSREHAIFTANTSAGSPQVFITDTKSMHGTFLNDTPLVPQTPKQLFNGDKLQFGVNVNRNESYFMAYKYTFKAELSNPEPFSRGFTVPEAESEEEEVDFISSGQGSQLNPLILDESDVEPEPEPELEAEENDDDTGNDEDCADVTLAHLEHEETGDIIDFAKEEDLIESMAEGMSSDIESDVASTGCASEYGLESPLVQEAQHIEETNTRVEVHNTQVEPVSMELKQPSLGRWTHFELPGPERVPDEYVMAESGPAIVPVSPTPQVANPWLVDEHTTSIDDVAPPLPPRPSQKRQRVWDEALQDEQAWHGAPSVTSEQGHFFNRDFFVAPTDLVPISLPAADRIQTPPRTEPADAAFSPLLCGSDVPTTENVEVQPPTPTSINGRKRSADEAFDAELEPSTEAKGISPQEQVTAPIQGVPTIDAREDTILPTIEEVPQHQRPIAQPKGIFRRALRAAKVMVPATALGAVFTVTALTTLPESFFTVA